MLQSASLIRTGKGKKRQEWNPAVDNKAEILKDVIGPSGNCVLQVGKLLMNLWWVLTLNFMQRSLDKWSELEL